MQRARPKQAKLAADAVLAAHVEVRLAAKDAPMTISIELKRGVFPDVEDRVPHEAIYAAMVEVIRPGFSGGSLVWFSGSSGLGGGR